MIMISILIISTLALLYTTLCDVTLLNLLFPMILGKLCIYIKFRNIVLALICFEIQRNP